MANRIPRPTARAVRNFLVGYCMAPAARSMGTIGNGGGSRAGIATAARPQLSKNRVYLLHFFRREPLLQCFFAPFASHAVGKISAKNGSCGCHDRVVEPRFAVV